MGNRYKEVGGGPATGLANDFVSFLQQGLNTGSFGGTSATQRMAGANPMGQTQGIAGVLNDILMGGAGNLGGSLGQMISKDTERQADALRARFGAGGGTAFGTPAAYAESLLRSEQAPKLATAVGGLQSNLLGQLFNLYGGLSQRGISQRETIATPNPLASAASIAAPVVGGALSAFAPNPLAGLFAGQQGAQFSNQLSTPFMNSNPSLFGTPAGNMSGYPGGNPWGWAPLGLGGR